MVYFRLAIVICMSVPLSATAKKVPDVVAVVDGRELKSEELQTLMRSETKAVRRRLQTTSDRRDFVERQVELELLAAEAQRQGLLDDPDVWRVTRQALARRLVDKKMAEHGAATEEELRAEYERRRDEFFRPAERRVAMIVLSKKHSGMDPGARALQLRDDAQAHRADGAYFRQLVEKYSEDAKSRSHGGATAYFTRDATAVPESVRTAAFSLSEIGDVAVMAASGTTYVIRLIGRHAAQQLSFEQVRERLARQLMRSRRFAVEKHFLADLRERAQIEIREAALRRIRLP